MWIKVLPADPAVDVFFREVPDEQGAAVLEFASLIHGKLERVYTQTLFDTFGNDPRVVMLVNEDGQFLRLPFNERATKYYPNNNGTTIRGTAILVGEVEGWEDLDLVRRFVSLPKKWKILHDMESAASDYSKPYQIEALHILLDGLLLEAVDEDIAKLYNEIVNDIPPNHWWNRDKR